MTASLDHAVEALKAVVEADGGMDRYANEDDEVGERACCCVVSYKPHDPDCYVIKCAKALAALPHLSPVVDREALWELAEGWKVEAEAISAYEPEMRHVQAEQKTKCADDLLVLIDNKQE